jgi:nitrite reductase (NADH) small subunit
MSVDWVVDPARMRDSSLSVTDIRWTAVCPYTRLAPDRGVAAQVDGAQVAIIRTHDGEVYAVSHRDPISGAHVMSRGIVGHQQGRATIASPDHRHVYDLTTGDCLDIPDVRLAVYPVRRRGDIVEIGVYRSLPR